ncbi:MAG: carbohydrate kinase family protein [Anaerolineae bacterium]|nr:carbohydrate kinase family protein [Phycisphaerae bacterium]
MTAPLTRQQICELTSRKLADAAPSLHQIRATLGLDGFVDEIIAVVDKRHAHDRFDSVRTIDELARKMAAAAGQSSNYELIVKHMKLGGNGPIMANALAYLGLAVSYVGNLGFPNIHPVFEDFASRARVISVAEPAHTDALEFDDGKLMLGKLSPLGEVNWDNIISRVGRDRLKELFDGAKLIGMVNWTMLPHMSRIWAKLLDEIIPHSERHTRKLFIDLADPEKRTHDDILDALKLLTRFQDQVDVILGLNLKEATEIADVLGLPGVSEPEAAIEENAVAIREELNLACVVIHPRRAAAAATSDGKSAKFAGPFVREPKISTGAGDHFNAGFCVGRVLGFSLEESLCAGVGASGYYVRTATSPYATQLAEIVADLPAPQ